jgi:fumarylacetoacetate (FAA) hydrolase
MKLVSFRFYGEQDKQRAGVLLPVGVIDLGAAAPLVFEDAEQRSWDMLSLLRSESDGFGVSAAAEIAEAVLAQIGEVQDDELYLDAPAGALSIGGADLVLPLDSIRMLAPLPQPTSLRDFYAFEEHVRAARRQRGQEVPLSWYSMPVFYFSNHGAIYGPEEKIPLPRTKALDYELEIACVIGREGRDLAEEEAEDYIAGYCIMNDWSARDIQREEMSVGLGPAKGKDFATSLGPTLVTPDELADKYDGEGRYNLSMAVRVNGVEQGRGNFYDIYYTFAQIIAQASRDVTLRPGDVIGSGTVGTGCLLETTGGEGPWLKPGDVVELEVERLGVLRNTIEAPWQE